MSTINYRIKQNKMTNRRKKEIEENLLPLINDSVLNISKTRGKIDQEFTVMGAPYSPHGENHLGIFFNSIIKDIMIRYQILNGKNSKHFVGWFFHLNIFFKGLIVSVNKLKNIQKHFMKRISSLRNTLRKLEGRLIQKLKNWMTRLFSKII